MRNVLAGALRHDNPRVVAPPGAIRPGPGRPIIVATVQRTGTHVLMDLVLNNLAPYRRRPLYIDADRFLGPLDAESALAAAEQVIAGGSYVVQTHHPALKARPHLDEAIRRIAAAGVVVTTRRDVDDAHRSLTQFVAGRDHAMDPAAIESAQVLADEMRRHAAFWQGRVAATVDFVDLFDPVASAALMARIAEIVGVEPRRRHRPAPPKSHRRRVLLAKALTRIAGRHSPVLNTTVGFGHGSWLGSPPGPASSR